MITDKVFLANMLMSAKSIGAGVASIGVIGAGVGIGVVFAGYMLALSNNPFMARELQRWVILGFALTEAMGLLGIMMSFLILYS